MTRFMSIRTGRWKRTLPLLLAGVALVTLISCSAAPAGTTPAAPVPAEMDVTDTHYGEDTFVGTVTGYVGDDGDDRAQIVVVDALTVHLDLVLPYDVACRNPTQQDRALEVKEVLLPIGEHVFVAISEYPNAFLHLVPGGAETPNVAPPAESVNELLVRSGYWAPYGFMPRFLHGDPEYADFAHDANATYTVDTGLTDLRGQYAPLLATAGNSARQGRVGGQAECIDQALGYAVDEQLQKEEYERDYQRFLVELKEMQERSRNSGCRDGDGDGICHER